MTIIGFIFYKEIKNKNFEETYIKQENRLSIPEQLERYRRKYYNTFNQ